MRDERPAPLQAAHEILDIEREALLAGRIEDLSAIVSRKVAAFRAIGATCDPSDLANLKKRIEGNQRLLEAAAKGIKAAMAQLSDLSRKTLPLRTYGADGATTTLTGRAGPASFNRTA